MPEMDRRERWGRIALALAVALLFLTVVGSMVAGGILWPGLVAVAAFGAGGSIGMLFGRRGS